LNFKVRPRLHLVTLFNLIPNFVLAIMLLVFSDYGLSDKFKYGAFIIIVISSVYNALSSLFEPWFSELEFKNGHVLYTTGLGGLVDVNLSNLDEEKSHISKSLISLVDFDGNTVDVLNKLYLKSDVVKMLDCLIDYVDS
jgi:hypothetical protein